MTEKKLNQLIEEAKEKLNGELFKKRLGESLKRLREYSEKAQKRQKPTTDMYNTPITL